MIYKTISILENSIWKWIVMLKPWKLANTGNMQVGLRVTSHLIINFPYA